MTTYTQAGTVGKFTASRKTGWLTVRFPKSFARKDRKPEAIVVNAQIQTRNGDNTPGLRLRNVTSESFEVRMDEIISSHTTSSTDGDLGLVESDGEHPHEETLGWVAIATYA